MEQFKECGIYMLSSLDSGRITFVKHTQGKNVGKLQMPLGGGEYRRLLWYGFEGQHLYIVSKDDKIKEGINVIYNNCVYRTVYSNTVLQGEILLSGYGYVMKSDCKKIIASTDKSLLPKIPQQFIEYFIEQYNKGNIIDKVMVEYIDNGEPFWDEKIELKVNPKDDSINIKLNF